VAAGVGLACPVFGVGVVAPKPKAQMTTSSPAFAGSSAVMRSPLAWVTNDEQSGRGVVTGCETRMVFGDGNTSQVLTTCGLSGIGATMKVLLSLPFSPTANTVTPRFSDPPGTGRSNGIWSVMTVMRQSGDKED
jgi:hypothetical protein